MDLRAVSRWRAVSVGLGVVGVLGLAGCELGVAPVTYELVDVDDFNRPIGPLGMAEGDVDRDGDVDVVVAGRNSTGVLTNDGSGAYVLDVRAGSDQHHPSLIDVDGDDDLDLVTAIPVVEFRSDLTPAVRRNDGTGVFGPLEPVGPPPGDLTGLVASDVDVDGDVDLIAAMRVGHDRVVATYLNDGTGAFGPPATYSLDFTSDTATPVHLVAGDLDGDGDDDVVATDRGRVATSGGETTERTFVMVGLNDGTGAFSAVGAPIDASPKGIVYALTPALVDLDGDG